MVQVWKHHDAYCQLEVFGVPSQMGHHDTYKFTLKTCFMILSTMIVMIIQETCQK
jgi:hypothetical protein